MKGDFSRERFDRSKHFNRVLKQQGRVELDSDWNEQAAIGQHLLRTLIVDLLGRAGGPVDHCGFALIDSSKDHEPVVGDFVLGAGRYYVDGMLVENEGQIYYSAQPDLPAPAKLSAGKTYLAYLDVWERHVTYLEDESIREVALGGPDTCTRAKTVWQVKVIDSGIAQDLPRGAAATDASLKKAQENLGQAGKALAAETVPARRTTLKRTVTRLEKQVATLEAQLDEAARAPAPPPGMTLEKLDCETLLKPVREWTSGTMTARLQPFDPSGSPCVLPPDSRYRGLENHLYRIEIHASGDTADANKVPTFKWSRENGSIATRQLGATGNVLKVASTRGFAAGQWVELTSEADDMLGQPGLLTRITGVDGNSLTVEAAPAWSADRVYPKVRRWNQSANDALKLVNGAIAIDTSAGGWIRIEDGIEVQFSAGQYRSGDYWLIPARVATGAIEWAADADGNALPLPPHGIEHHYAPLFLLTATGATPFVTLNHDCRCRFAPLPCLAEGKGYEPTPGTRPR
jgi:uncharacterized protein DUF6519